MSITFLLLTIVFIIISAIMVLIILVQRPQGGGLAGAFGGAAGGSTDTVFGGRVGDALTMMTVGAFLAYILLAVFLNIVPIRNAPPVIANPGPVITSTNPDGLTNTLPLTPADGPPPTNANTLPTPALEDTSAVAPPVIEDSAPVVDAPADDATGDQPATTPSTTEPE